MGGGGKGGPNNQQLENSQAGLAQQLTTLLGQQGGESQQLFNLAFPGMQTSENFYQTLASGDPGKIAMLLAPAAQQINQASAGAKQNIIANSPAGGEKNLALSQVDVNQGAQVGQLASQGYLSAFQGLASLGTSGVGLGQGAANTAISAGNSANSAYSGLIQEHMQQKGATLGTFGALGGDVASGLGGGLGASAGGAGAKGSAAAGLLAF